MKIRSTLLRNALLSIGYLALLQLYIRNDLNMHLLGIVSDSFWLTGVSTIYVIFLLRKTGFRLSDGYFRMRRWELSSAVYGVLGVTCFKRMVRKYPLPSLTLKIDLTGRSRSGILDVENRMREAEQIHVFGLLLTLALSVVFSLWRDIRFLPWFTAFNVIMNLYPILLQRYNRNRVRVVLERSFPEE